MYCKTFFSTFPSYLGEPEMTQMWLQPVDQTAIQQIFNAMKHCQSLNPDPADSLSEDDENYMEAEDDYLFQEEEEGNENDNDRFDDVGQGDMQHLQIDDEDKFADAQED